MATDPNAHPPAHLRDSTFRAGRAPQGSAGNARAVYDHPDREHSFTCLYGPEEKGRGEDGCDTDKKKEGGRGEEDKVIKSSSL